MIQIPVLIISILLFIVLFFGIGFILNMLLRKTWVVAIVYPLIAALIVNNQKLSSYVTDSGSAFVKLGERFISLQVADILILTSGLLGAIGSGITIRMLRQRGYRMF